MIYTVTLNPSVDRTLTIEHFHVGGTFKASHSNLLPAGKGVNVARVAATLGERVAALALVGEHEEAIFAAALGAAQVEHRLYPIPGATRNSTTILDPARRTETHVREQGSSPSPEALARVANGLEDVRAGDWVVFAGSLPPDVPPETYRELVRRCSDRGAYTLLDSSGAALLLGADAPPTLLKPNLFELWQVDCRQPTVSDEKDLSSMSMSDVLAAARRVQRRGIALIAASLGARGVLGLDADGHAWHAAVTLEEPVVDAVGSGDALAAGLVVALARGEPLSDALRLGVACGAANTQVAGAGRCRNADIVRLAAHATVTLLE